MSDLPLSTFRIDEEVKIRMGESGLAADAPTTIMKVFEQTVAKHGSKPALFQKIDGTWQKFTWKQYHEKVNNFAKSLLSIGFQRFDTISILG